MNRRHIKVWKLKSERIRRINSTFTFTKSLSAICLHLKKFGFLPSLFGIHELLPPVENDLDDYWLKWLWSSMSNPSKSVVNLLSFYIWLGPSHIPTKLFFILVLLNNSNGLGRQRYLKFLISWHPFYFLEFLNFVKKFNYINISIFLWKVVWLKIILFKNSSIKLF